MLQVPRNEALDSAESANLLVFATRGILEQVLCRVVAHVEDDRAGQVGQHGVLLELERHDRGVGFAVGADRHALLGVADGAEEDGLCGGERHGGDAEAAGEEAVSYLEETGVYFGSIRQEFSFGSDVIEPVEHGFARDDNLVEDQSSVINTVKPQLHPHILDINTLTSIHLLIADRHDETVDALVDVADPSLSENDRVVGVAGAVGDPEFLGFGGGGVDGEGLFGGVVFGGGLHFGSVVAVSKLGEAEAAHVLEAVDVLHEGQVAVGVEGRKRSTEQVELDRELGGERAIDHAEHLVGGEDVLRVVVEVKDRDDSFVTDALDLGVGAVTLLVERQVELVGKDGVLHQLKPLGSLVFLIIEEHFSQIVRGGSVKRAQNFNVGF